MANPHSGAAGWLLVIPEIRLEVEFLTQQFQIEDKRIQTLLTGPVMKNLVARAIRVQAAAMRNATGEGGGPHVVTGRLRASITYRLGVDSRSPYVDIGTGVYYAPFVEFGHRNTAHFYPLMTPGGKFAGGVGYVSDKPTRPYPFLLPAALAARTT